MVSRDTRDILFRFRGDAKNLKKASRDASGSLKKTGTAFTSAGKAAAGFVAALAVAKVGQFAGDAIQLAVAAAEVDSKFKAVFGTATELTTKLREWGDVAGVTEARGRDLAATFGNLALAQGLSRKQTEDLTLKVAELAGDMGSFNDIDPEQVFFDLNKALLTTEREGMKKYGVALTETEIKQRALQIAMNDGRTEFTKGDKALASYELTVQQVGKAVGDLERTSGSTANVQRQLRASFKETQEELGRELLPVYEDLLGIVVDLEPALKHVIVQVGELATDFGFLTSAISDLGGDEGKGNLDRVSDAVAGLIGIGGQLFGNFTPGIDEMQGAFDRLGETAPQALGLTAEVLAGRYNPMMGVMADVTEEAAAALVKVTRGLNNFGEVNLNDAILGYFKELNGLALSLNQRIAVARSSGGGGGSQNIKAFATGGMVEGARGKAQLAVVHGGERVQTPQQQKDRGGGGGSGITINVSVSPLSSPTETAREIVNLLETYNRNTGPINIRTTAQ